jgi:type IV secretory pathway TraG/TraD family ATPase VirD4
MSDNLNRNSNWWAFLEVEMNNISMMAKSLKIISQIGFLSQIIIAYFLVKWNLFDFPFKAYMDAFGDMYHHIDYYFSHNPQYDDFKNWYARIVYLFLKDLGLLFLFTLPIHPILLYFSQKYFGKKADDMMSKRHISGAKLISEKELIKLASNKPYRFHLANIPLAIESELTHVLVGGASGNGKTLFLRKVFKVAFKIPKAKGLIHDFKGDFVSEYFDASKHLIFNPMDARSLKWTIWNDINDIADLQNFCNWIIPDNPSAKDQFWTKSGRGILEGIMLYLWKNNKTTNKDIANLTRMSSEQLGRLLKENGLNIAADYALKQDSLSNFRSYMNWVYFLSDGDFSVKEWVNNGTGFIFLSNIEKTQESFKPMLSLFVNVVGSSILSLDENLDRRIYLFLDEFGMLNRLDQIIRLFVAGRSKGASVWTLFQENQRIEQIYSQAEMKTIMNNTANIVSLGLNEASTAKYFSERFSKMEFLEKSQTVSMGVAVNRDGLTFSEQRRQDYIVKDSDLLTVAPLKAYVKVRGVNGVALSDIEIIKGNPIQPAFIQVELTKEEQIELLAPSLNKKSSSSSKEKSKEFDLEEEFEEKLDAALLEDINL